jgi:hypothetical protein
LRIPFEKLTFPKAIFSAATLNVSEFGLCQDSQHASVKGHGHVLRGKAFWEITEKENCSRQKTILNAMNNYRRMG